MWSRDSKAFAFLESADPPPAPKTVPVSEADGVRFVDVGAEADRRFGPGGSEEAMMKSRVRIGRVDAPATVRVIDPPAEPDRDTAGRLIRVGAVGLIGAAVATTLMWLLAPGRPSSRETTHPSGIEGGEIR